MTLIRSISGIRGTLGGRPGEGLTPLDVVRYTAAFGWWAKERSGLGRPRMIIGRDARISGPMVNDLVRGTLVGLGFEVIDLGLATTPTVEMAVAGEKAQGGIILTASHNPAQWNALKLLNEKGEFISGEDGAEVLQLAENDRVEFAPVEQLGSHRTDDSWLQKHINAIIHLELVDVTAIKSANLKVAVDAVNSVGGVAVPALLQALGVEQVIKLYCDPTGNFPHNPEPLPAHLKDLCDKVKSTGAHVGFAVDPDVDRLAIVCEDGSLFGEEYTLVACADHALQHRKGDTVSNMSSTRALRDVTEGIGGVHHASAVGEVNVVNMMKAVNAVIGGEGNGGVILPELHYGRDALAGIALFLTLLAKAGTSCSDLRKRYPNYFISKNKIQLEEGMDVDGIIAAMDERYPDQPKNREDGLKIEFGREWVHLRKSNTEPIIRIYSESENEKSADDLARRIMSEIGMVASAVKS